MFYSKYTFPISPHSSHRTTLLNTKVLNLQVTQVGVSKLGSTYIHLSTRVSKWMGHRLLSRQSSCPEATAIHILDSPGWVFVLRQDGASSTRHRRFPGAKGTRFHSSNGRRIHRILTQSTIYSFCNVGLYCRRKFTHPELLTWMN